MTPPLLVKLLRTRCQCCHAWLRPGEPVYSECDERVGRCCRVCSDRLAGARIVAHTLTARDVVFGPLDLHELD